MWRKLMDTAKGGKEQSSSLSASDRADLREIQAQRAEDRYKAQQMRGIGGNGKQPSKTKGAGLHLFSSSSDSDQGLPSGLGNIVSACPAESSMVLTIIRSALWTDDGTEDTWQVQVSSYGTVADVKTAIASLYQLPQQAQRLQATGYPGDVCYLDSKRADTLLQAPIYLMPAIDTIRESSDSEDAVRSQIAQHIPAEMQENAKTLKAMAESLEGITYNISFHCPGGVGGAAIDKTITLSLDPMALIADVLSMVEVEMLGMQSNEATVLIHNAQPLPTHIPLHFAGICNGDIVYLASTEAGKKEEDINDGAGSDYSLDDAMLAWSHGECPPSAL